MLRIVATSVLPRTRRASFHPCVLPWIEQPASINSPRQCLHPSPSYSGGDTQKYKKKRESSSDRSPPFRTSSTRTSFTVMTAIAPPPSSPAPSLAALQQRLRTFSRGEAFALSPTAFIMYWRNRGQQQNNDDTSRFYVVGFARRCQINSCWPTLSMNREGRLVQTGHGVVPRHIGDGTLSTQNPDSSSLSRIQNTSRASREIFHI